MVFGVAFRSHQQDTVCGIEAGRIDSSLQNGDKSEFFEALEALVF